MLKYLLFFLVGFTVYSQDAYHIKSFQYEGAKESIIPVYKLGESISFSFDDLLGTEIDYYYRITHCDKHWKPSELKRTEYSRGAEWVRLRTLTNSFNTLQAYTHYQEAIPSQYQKILLSGNYLLEIADDNEEILLTRKFIVYEDLVTVEIQPKRSRDMKYTSSKQNIYVNIDLGNSLYQNPKEYMHLVLMQNGQFFNSITGVKPQFSIGNQLKYQYDNQTSFWGGNEFLFFDNSDIRHTNHTIGKVTAADLYESHLFTDSPQKDKGYTFMEDINGAFYPNIRYKTEKRHIEADYSWVFFTLDMPKITADIFVAGMFNGYEFSQDNKMSYNEQTKKYELALLLKQGFTSYQYYISKEGKIDLENSINGNYFETENQYHAIVYYKAPTDRYDRAIGMASVKAINITN